MESLQRDISDERDARRPDGRDELDKSNSPATRPKRNRRDKRDNGIDMLNGPIPSRVILFAIPLALTSIFQQLFNTADSVVAGRFIDNAALAAVGGVAPIIALFVSLFVGLSIGANVVVAVHIGHQDYSRIRGAIQTTAIVSLVSGIALTLVGIVATDPILGLVNMPLDAWDQARIYLHIYFAGIIFYSYL